MAQLSSTAAPLARTDDPESTGAGPGRATGAGTVAHAELPNAHHAFDTLATVRSQMAADAVADFLGIAYGRRQMSPAAVLHHAGHAG